MKVSWRIAHGLTASVMGLLLLHASVAFAQDPPAAAALTPAAAAAAAGPDLNDSSTCLGCHSAEGLAATMPDGTVRQLHVPPDKFGKSVHASLPCVMCHQAITSIPHSEEARTASVDCGGCHADQQALYAKSVHGRLFLESKYEGAAQCKSCHGIHDIGHPKEVDTRVQIAKNCGSCHVERYQSYTETYHGQIHSLGYAYTAHCFDCHGSHNIQMVADPTSTVHKNNRLKTCQTCHANATAGFVTFEPHANTHDFERYPAMFVVAKGMLALITGVFAFFWTHSVLWFYREWQDRKHGVPRPHIVPGELPKGQEHKYIERFRPWWRAAHLAFALCLMTLSLTGMAVFYSKTTWAASFVQWLGGPQVAAKIHRVAGVMILAIFILQILYFVVKVLPKWRTFKWFGHTSLIPSLQDGKDIIAMFQWFFGKGPRPVFGRWNYLERFDYWAPFWGLTIVGGSGVMLWFKEATAAVWPGWMFNVASLAHGEEAFLAIVFLFTVHFFNNHFRPDKLPPPDVVMFTGAVDLDEFKREHTLEYEELVRTGKLQERLVDRPSPAMTLSAKILGIVLLIFGLTLLALVGIGFFSTLMH